MKATINWIDYLKNERIYLYGLDFILIKLINSIKQKEEEKFSRLSLAKSIKVCPRSLYYWLEGKRPIPLNIFLKLINLSNYQLNDILNDIEMNLKGIAMGWGNSNKLVKLPFLLTHELAYFVGYLFGDGCLKSKEYNVHLVDEYSEQINNIQLHIFSLFGIKGKIVRKQNKTEIMIYSKALWIFLNKIFGMPIGKKYKIKIPDIINFSDFRLSFVKGFIDADGGIFRIEEYKYLPKWIVKSPNIEVSSKYKIILQQIKDILEDYDLMGRLYFHRTNQSYRLFLNGKINLLKCNKIGIFKHPVKAMRLNQLCSKLY